jgi:predicted anti-sigma-YlaC factor YlaD
MGCQHLEELYELWLLGAAPEQAAQDLREHLARGCPQCRARLREAAETVYLLGLVPKPARPNPGVKTELLRQVARRTAPDR